MGITARQSLSRVFPLWFRFPLERGTQDLRAGVEREPGFLPQAQKGPPALRQLQGFAPPLVQNLPVT